MKYTSGFKNCDMPEMDLAGTFKSAAEGLQFSLLSSIHTYIIAPLHAVGFK